MPDVVRAVVVASPAVRQRLRAALSSTPVQVCVEAEDPDAALDALGRFPVDLCLLDVSRVEEPVGVVERLVGTGRTRVIVLSAQPDDPGCVDAMLAGAGGYLPIDAAPGQILATASEVLRGGTAVPRRFERALVERLRAL